MIAYIGDVFLNLRAANLPGFPGWFHVHGELRLQRFSVQPVGWQAIPDVTPVFCPLVTWLDPLRVNPLNAPIMYTTLLEKE
jgi:hypothetical protein